MKDKDALDVLRILRTIPIRTLAEGLGRLQADSLSGEFTREALVHLGTLFGSISELGREMVIRATERLADARGYVTTHVTTPRFHGTNYRFSEEKWLLRLDSNQQPSG